MTKDVLKHELVPEHDIVADNNEKLLKNLIMYFIQTKK
jgi:DNA-directed RNA polymerase subunit H (RpoH/RPB5)